MRHAGSDDAALVLVGPNWRGGQDRLEALARTLGITGSVSFAGPASGTEKWSLLTAADLFVHPSRWEAGIPFAVLEALLAGRPVLLTRAADPDGLVERYGAGFVTVPRPDSIAKGLIEVSRLDPVRLQELSWAARRLVDREFPVGENLQGAAQRVPGCCRSVSAHERTRASIHVVLCYTEYRWSPLQ